MSTFILKHGDCLEVMKEIPDASVDMILCDLPYGKTQNKDDKPLPFAELWGHYKRIIKDDGAILLFAQGAFYVELVNSNRKMFRYDLIWDKQLVSGFLNAKRMPLRQHEQIAVFYKKMPTYNPQFTEGKPLHGMGNKFRHSKNKNNNYGIFDSCNNPSAERKGDTKKYPKSILTFPRKASCKMVHPTQKPVSLLEYLIRTYTNEGDTVLDNCMGSGSTGVACINTGRNFYGVEKNEQTFETAVKRIKKAQEGHHGQLHTNSGTKSNS